MKQLLQLEKFFFYSLILFLPTQLGKHLWPDFSYVLGIRIDYLSPTIFTTDILVAGLFIFWFLRSLMLRREPKIKDLHSPSSGREKSKIQFKIQNSQAIFTFAVLYLIFNILVSGRMLGGLYSLLKLLEMSFLAYYTAKFTPYHHGEGFIDLKKHFQKIILLFSTCIIFESILAIAQFLKQGSIGGVLYFLGERTFNGSTPGIANASLNGELVLRPYGTFPHPNVLAGYLVITMILILFSLQKEKPVKELGVKNQGLSFYQQIISPVILNSYFLLQVTALVFGTVALILSMSRIAILLWVLVLIYRFFTLSFRAEARNLNHKNSLKRSFGALRLLRMTLILFAAIFILSPFGARFTKLNIGDEAVVEREVLISSAIKLIESSPLVGIGLGNFIPTLSKIQKPLTLGLYLQPVHNIFLLVAAETGLIGLGFSIWFIFKTYKRLFNCHPELVSGSKKKIPDQVRNDICVSLVIALSAILILGLFDHYWLTLQQGQLLFAIIIGFSYNKSTLQKLT